MSQNDYSPNIKYTHYSFTNTLWDKRPNIQSDNSRFFSKFTFHISPTQYERAFSKLWNSGLLPVRNCKTTNFAFYIHGSVHPNSILIRSNKMQRYAGIYLLQNHSTCFGCPSHPSSGVHKTVTAASSTGHSI